MKLIRVTVTTKDGKNHVGGFDPKTRTVEIAGGKRLKPDEYSNLTKAEIVKP